LLLYLVTALLLAGTAVGSRAEAQIASGTPESVSASEPQCEVRSDGFDGAALDKERWSAIVREDSAGYSVSGGALVLPTSPTDIYGTGNGGTPNIILQPLPDGAWQATAHLTMEAYEAYQQAGLIVYGDDDNYAKIVLQARSTFGPDPAARIFQFIREEAGAPNEVGESNSAQLGAAYPDTVWVRLTSDGSNLNASYSADGQTFTPMPQTKSLAGITNPRIGLFALAATSRPVADARFHEFAFTPDEPCSTSFQRVREQLDQLVAAGGIGVGLEGKVRHALDTAEAWLQLPDRRGPALSHLDRAIHLLLWQADVVDKGKAGQGDAAGLRALAESVIELRGTV
jgi:regulation of enolase protein 1 (concanavalin A-like superfamily)